MLAAEALRPLLRRHIRIMNTFETIEATVLGRNLAFGYAWQLGRREPSNLTSVTAGFSAICFVQLMAAVMDVPVEACVLVSSRTRLAPENAIRLSSEGDVSGKARHCSSRQACKENMHQQHASAAQLPVPPQLCMAKGSSLPLGPCLPRTRLIRVDDMNSKDRLRTVLSIMQSGL